MNVLAGQSIIDLCIQGFGDIENLFDMFKDNPQIGLNSKLVSGQDILIIADEKGIENIKNEIRLNDITLVNRQGKPDDLGLDAYSGGYSKGYS